MGASKNELKNELHDLIELIPPEETLVLKRFIEFLLSKVKEKERELNPGEFEGQTFYIEGPAGKYAELDFWGLTMELDDVAGTGRFTWYDEHFDEIGYVDFDKDHLPRVWPVYYALASKCANVSEPFLYEYSLEKIKRYVGIKESIIPRKLSTNLEVAKLIWSGVSYSEAVTIIQKRRGLKSWHTVADQLTRQMGINTAKFKELVSDKEKFIQHLIEKCPKYKDVIIMELS